MMNLFEKLGLSFQNVIHFSWTLKAGPCISVSLHIGSRLVSLGGGGFSNSCLIGSWYIRESSKHFFHWLCADNFLLRLGGAMFDRTCNQGTGVESTAPEIVRIAMFNCTSILSVWQLLYQTGAQYSAVEYTNERAAVRNTLPSAPHLDTSHFLAFIENLKDF